MNRMMSGLIALLLAASMFIGMMGCEKEDTFEKAGKKVDEAVEEIKDKAGDVADEAKDKAGELKKQVDQAMDKK